MSGGASLAGALAMVATICALASLRLRADPEIAALSQGPRTRSIPHRMHRMLSLVGSAPPFRGRGSPRLLEQLGTAGWSIDPTEVVGLGVLAALGPGLLCLVAPGPIPLVAPVVALSGYRCPFLLVSRAAARRRALAQRDLPDLLDMLSAAAGAGVPGPLALRRAAEVTDGPLGRELRRAFAETDLGARWREQVEHVALRLGLADLRRVTAALARSGVLGSGLADPLRILADDVREERRSAAAARARRAPVTMLFPLVFLILPAFLLLTVVPVLVTTLGSIR